MYKQHTFHQLDVFTDIPYKGNPLAVVHDAQDLSDAQMASFAHWTNLSETTFLLPPADPAADYRVRIFTPGGELPFAGHPTLGSCAAWLRAGGVPRQDGMVVQECGVGLVRIRRSGTRLAFAAPPLRRSGPLDAASLQKITHALGLSNDDIVDHQWVDNGPGWCALMLRSAEQVLAVKPDFAALGDFRLGLAAPQPACADTDYEVRVFVPSLGVPEDPVTGSLNAGLAQWLIGAGAVADSYVVRQGTVLGRAGKVFIERIGDDIWIGGEVVDCIEGTVKFPPA
jgi:PhzF family phenazine biosynthesis protein